MKRTEANFLINQILDLREQGKGIDEIEDILIADGE